MKYIRTKDGIYEVLEIYTYTKKKLGVIIESLGCKTENENELKTIFYGDVLKQADTIEELIDCYVILYKDGTKGILFTPTEINIELAKTESVYGAIFTDKGIIYKAKMNEEGELELI